MVDGLICLDTPDEMDHDTKESIRPSPMSRLHKNVIRATDIAAQFWCEKQMELGYLYGKEATPEMRNGAEVHKNIETIINIPVNLKPESYPDSLYRSLYTSYLGVSTLRERGAARELNIYGSINGFKIAGKIDEIRYEDGKTVVYEDKIKMSDREPSSAQIASHRMQVLLYIKMLNDIKRGLYTFSNFARGWGTDKMRITDSFSAQLKDMGIKEGDMTVGSIAALYFSSLMDAGDISDMAFIRYTNAQSGNIIKSSRVEYSQNDFEERLKYAMVYWNGFRDAKPVDESEKWKCNYCPFFGKQCTTWYQAKQKVL
jgi:exonuclease V